MGALSYFSPGDILKSCPLELGAGDFCFLVAELLTARYRLAVLWRLTDHDRKRYAHVFLRVSGVPLDIKGFRKLDAMYFDYNDYGLVAERVDARSVREFFDSKYSAEQRSAASVVLSAYIGKHPEV